MNADEIFKSYMSAKNKSLQIKILSELNDCDIDDIVISIADKLNPNGETEQTFEPKPTVGIMEMLVSHLDNLDQQISELEKEYKETTVAMKVVSQIMGVLNEQGIY